MKTIEEYVWFYYEHGLSVIPLGANGDLKRPSIKEWKQYQTKRATKKQIKTWLSDSLFVGIGLIGGKVSDNFAVIDIDDADIPEQVGLDLDEFVERGNWVVKTGKGWHIYTKGVKNVPTRNQATASMDLKGEGGYVVAPPSPHESGNIYRFTSDVFHIIPKHDIERIFSNIVKQVHTIRNFKPPKARNINSEDGVPPCISKMKEGTEDGRRNGTLYALACYYIHMMKNKMPDNDIKLILTDWNKSLEHSLDQGEFDATYNSAVNSEHSYGCTAIKNLGYCPYITEADGECPFMTDDTPENKDMELYQVWNEKHTKVYYHNLAKLIVEAYDYNFLVVKDESTDKKMIYSYTNGYYTPNGEDIIRHLVSKYLKEHTTEKSKLEVLAAIKDMKDKVSRSELEPDKKYINLRNGVLNVETMKLTSHKPDMRFLQKIPIDYVPRATASKIMKFFTEVIKPEELAIVQEMFGYALYRGYSVGSIFILFGTGRNGKGVTMKLLRELIGHKNICSRKLHELNDDTFAKADLYGRMVNICGEMNDETLKNTGNMKELTGEDYVTAQRKYHGSFQFQNYAKLIFSTNAVPKSMDRSFGFFDRMRIVNFTKIFNAASPATDAGLGDRLISDAREMEGLLVWALEGLQRILKTNKVSGEESLENMGDKYEDAVNFVWNWLENTVTVTNNNEDYITVNETYTLFNDYCIRNDKPRIARNSFTKQLFGYCKVRGGIKSRKQIDGGRVYVYMRTRINTDAYESEGTPTDLDGMMKLINERTPAPLGQLVKEFGKSPIEHLKTQGILIRRPDKKWELDI